MTVEAVAVFAVCTVSENVVACCNEPAVAVTVIVDATDLELAPPPGGATQPTNKVKLSALTANSTSRKLRRLFPPERQNNTASAETGNHRVDFPMRAADPVVVVTVNAETMLPAAVTVEGAKLQAAPVGKPEQVNATAEVEDKPFSGVTVIVSVPLFPAVKVSVAGETDNVKSAAGVLATVVALAWLEAGEVPSESVASTT